MLPALPVSFASSGDELPLISRRLGGSEVMSWRVVEDLKNCSTLSSQWDSYKTRNKVQDSRES